MDGRAGVRQRFTALEPVLDEKSRRLLVAAESKAWGLGGISVVCKATGVSRQVIRQGMRELEEAPTHPAGRIRRAGGGRKRAKQKDPTLVADLEKLVEPTARGDPESCLRWTCKSVRKLAEQLEQMGHRVSYPVVAELLHEMEYSLQANRKTKDVAHVGAKRTRFRDRSRAHSPPMAAAATGLVCACGKWNCRCWPTRRGSPSR